MSSLRRPRAQPACRAISLAFLASLALRSQVAAAPSLSLVTSPGPPGGEVPVEVLFENDGTVVALQLDLVYDPAALTPGAAEAGPALLSSDHDLGYNEIEPGRLRLLVLSLSGSLVPRGLVARAPFTLAPGLSIGAHVMVAIDAPELVKGDASTVSATLGDGDLAVIPCFQGDVHPDGVGNARVNLADFVQAVRTVRLGGTPAARYTTCGALAAGSLQCTGADFANWCPGAPDGTFDQADALAVRRVMAGVQRVSCGACVSVEIGRSGPLVPADVAPSGNPNGILDIADVVRLLRMSVQLETPTPREKLIGDVAPSLAEGGLSVVQGNLTIDVADVVLALRAAVSLNQIAWKLRDLKLSLGSPTPFVAFTATVRGLPGWAEQPIANLPMACEATLSGIDVAAGTWALTCLADPALQQGAAGVLATLKYRAPQSIDLAKVTLKSELVNAALATAPAVLSLQAP